VKAKLPRSEASSKKAKAPPRPSSVVIKKAPARSLTTNAAKLVKPATPTKPVARSAASAATSKPAASIDKSRALAKPAAAKPASPAASSKLGSVVSSKASAPKTAEPKAAAPSKQAAPAKPAAPATPAKQAAPAKPVKPAKQAAPTKPAAAPVATAAPVAAPVKKPARKSIKEAAGVSTDAVARRTGKTWDDWFEVLDSAGAQNLDQRGIIAILAQKHGIGPWWQQMIAVGYESLRAKADKPAVSDGFQISKSCTLDAPLTRVFRLWNDPGERARWLSDERFVVRGATTDRVIRARWGKGNSHVAVSFSEKSGKTEVSVEHHQIESRSAAEQMKAYWAKKLGLLDEALQDR